jgi:TRAP-type mannitol/chloroaromatic compound transport system substrate-binding protein
MLALPFTLTDQKGRDSKRGEKMKHYLTTLAAAVVGIGMAAQAQAETLRIQTSNNAGDFTQMYEQKWAEKLHQMSGGELTLEWLPIDAVVPSTEVLDAVAAGVLEGAYEFTGRFAGKDPAYAILADLVAAYDNPDQGQMFCMNAGGKEMIQKLHDKYTDNSVHVIGCGPFSREPLIASKPIRSVADLQGVKVRAPEGLSALLFERAGATPVPIPYSEIYTALDKKIIDAANGSSHSNNESAGIYKLAPYPIYPGIESQALIQFIINKNVWDGLTEAQQAILETWYIAMSTDVRRASLLEDRKLLQQQALGQGDVIEVIDWPLSERNKLREIARGAWEEMAARTPLAEEAYQKQLEFIRLLGLVE